MAQSIAHVTLLVRDYDEAIAFYVGRLGFDLIEDTYRPEQDKRWVVVAPPAAASRCSCARTISGAITSAWSKRASSSSGRRRRRTTASSPCSRISTARAGT
jgi:hypothetical protein